MSLFLVLVSYLIFLPSSTLSSPLTGFPTQWGGCPSFAQYVPLNTTELPQEIWDAISEARVAALLALQAENTPGMSIGIVYNQDLIWSGGIGLTNLSDPTSIPNADTIYRIASISKIFSVIELLYLQEQGKLSIDDEVSKYIPLFTIQNPWINSSNARKITFRQLATHLAGLPREPPCPYADCNITNEEAYQRISTFTMLFPQNTQSQYSNLGFAILGNSLAQLTNQTFENLIQNNILNPLKLISTGVNISKADPTRIAVPYLDGPSVCSNCLNEHGWSSPGGSFYSTVNDLATLTKFFFRDNQAANISLGQILDSTSIHEMNLIHYLDNDQATAFCMPWELFKLGDYYVHAKRGGISGYGSEIMIIPRIKLGIIVLANQEEHAQTTAQEMASILVPVFDNVLQSVSKPLFPSNLISFFGTYQGTYQGYKVQALIYQPNINQQNLPIIFNLNGTIYQLYWLGQEQDSLKNSFRIMAPPGDVESCLNLQDGKIYQIVNFQFKSDGITVASLSLDIFYGVSFLKTSSEVNFFDLDSTIFKKKFISKNKRNYFK